MIRTIVSTTVKSGKISFVKGLPVVTDEKSDILQGNVTAEQALKVVQKKYGKTTAVIETVQEKAVYELADELFMKYAVKVEAPVVTAEPVEKVG